jgi:hypothetical protein
MYYASSDNHDSFYTYSDRILKNKSTFSCPLCRTVLATKNIANFEQYAFQDIPENDGKTDDEPSCEMCEGKKSIS